MTTVRTIQQLNAPQPVQVETGPTGMPERVQIGAMKQTGAPHRRRQRRQLRPAQKLEAIRSDGQWMDVVSIEDFWKINDEWWRGEEQEIERVYFDLVLQSSQRLTVFHDLVNDEWFRQAD